MQQPEDKEVVPIPNMTWIGIEFDTVVMQVCIPRPKIIAAVSDI